MITHISSLTFSGIDIIDVDVQIHIKSGIPKFTIVGLADKTIAESKERVQAALSSIGLGLPVKKILINLSPADLVKEGSHFDLAISVALLASMGILPEDRIRDYIVLGELSLDAAILSVNGILPASMGANARSKGIICSHQNGSEAAWSGNENVIAPSNLLELINHFNGTQLLSTPKTKLDDKVIIYPDLNEIQGQVLAKRALEIAAAGGHNLLLSGAPGTGKSMLAQRLPGIMPQLSITEILECSTISSIAGRIQDGCLVRERPFRAPHHSCTSAAMVGGGMGRKIKPGEISLAHNGVLFLDELPEFNSQVIEALRQPLESKNISISRSGANVQYPANFQLIAAMNPCKCGYVSDETKACSRAPLCASNYQSKISGPILDRFDLLIDVDDKPQYYEHNKFMLDTANTESSAVVAKRVLFAHQIQAKRYEGYDIRLNNMLNGQLLIEYAIPNDDGLQLLNEAAKKFRLSMRAYNKILRISRTIADLANSSNVTKMHVAEALQYRKM